MKKILALAIAVIMICACVFTVSAAEETLPDQAFVGWWTAWSKGIEVTSEGVTITFHAQADADATQNYQSPSLVIHAGSAEALGTEYWVQRADAWGWCYGENVGDHAAALQGRGYAWEYTFAEGFDWANFVAGMVAGADAVVDAKLEGSNLLLNYAINGVNNKVTIPVDISKPVYIAITGEKCAISNVKVITPDPAPAVVPVEDGQYILSWGDLTFAALEEGKDYGYCPAGSAAAPQDTDVVTITNTADGKFTMQDSYGRYIYMKGNYNSFNVGAEAVECYEWILEDAGDGKVYLKNVGKEKYVSYSEQYTTWGSYADKADSGLLVIAPAATLEPDPTEPVTPSEPAPTEPVAPIEPPVDTGDAIGVVVALLAVSGTALVVLKKKEN